eukprot:3348449-Amphidinium_carterae.1
MATALSIARADVATHANDHLEIRTQKIDDGIRPRVPNDAAKRVLLAQRVLQQCVSKGCFMLMLEVACCVVDGSTQPA